MNHPVFDVDFLAPGILALHLLNVNVACLQLLSNALPVFLGLPIQREESGLARKFAIDAFLGRLNVAFPVAQRLCLQGCCEASVIPTAQTRNSTGTTLNELCAMDFNLFLCSAFKEGERQLWKGDEGSKPD